METDDSAENREDAAELRREIAREQAAREAERKRELQERLDVQQAQGLRRIQRAAGSSSPSRTTRTPGPAWRAALRSARSPSAASSRTTTSAR